MVDGALARGGLAVGAGAAGDLDARIPDATAAGRDEVGELVASINSMADNLQRSNALERQFLMSVSHDLRTPLTSIKGYAEALTDGAIVDHQQAYDRAKRVLQERRNAMGWGGGGGSGAHRREAAAARGAGGGGSLDLRVMLGAKRLREETVASSNGRAADPLRQDDESSRFGGEARTREQLMAAGFPPELARRAASAYPDHAERAADWIISSNDW